MNLKTKAFLFINFILYIAFLTLDLFYGFSQISSICKFLIVFNSFLFCSGRFKIPLFITVLSDLILLFTSYNSLGVAVFSFAHIFYWKQNYKFLPNNLKNKKKKLFLFSAVFFGIIFLFSPLAVIYLFYAFCFFFNFLSAFYACKKAPSKKQTLFLIGLFLFALCDVNVVFYNLTDNTLSFYLMWIFYAPSQTFISLSS